MQAFLKLLKMLGKLPRPRLRRSIEVNGNYPKFMKGNIIVFKTGNTVCCKKILLVKNLSTTLLEMGAADLLSFARGYLRTLNMGFPIEIRTFVVPIDKDTYLRDLERRVSTLKVIIESNPSASKIKARLEELLKIRDHIVKHGLPPVGLVALIVTEACNACIDEALTKVNRQARLLKNAFSSLGIRVEDMGKVSSALLKQLFFRHDQRSRLNGIAGHFVRKLYAKVFIGLSALLLQPFTLGGDLLSNVRSGGIYLGRNPENEEKIFWNVRSSLSPHVLVIGPTGSGKTEFLALLTTRVQHIYGIGGIVLDIKGEYSERLRRRGAKFVELRPGENLRLDLQAISELLPPNSRAGIVTDIIAGAYPNLQQRETLSILYRAVERSLGLHCRSLARCVRKYVELERGGYESYSVSKALSEIGLLSECGGTSFSDVMLEHIVNRSQTITLLNLSRVAAVSRELIDFTIHYMTRCLKAIIALISPSKKVFDLRSTLVLDEGWIYVSRLAREISSLMRLGRSYGIMVCVATQSLNDLKSLGEGIMNNVGLLIALASPDRAYWRELSDYIRIPDIEVNRYTTLLGRGEGIVRISPDPRPRIVSFRD